MEATKRNKIIKWAVYAIILSLIVIVIYFAFFANSSKAASVSYSQFQSHINRAIENANDNIFIKNLKFDWYLGTANYTFVENGKNIQYIANLSRDGVNEWTSVTKAIGDLKLFGAETTVANSNVDLSATSTFNDLLNRATAFMSSNNKIESTGFLINDLPVENNNFWKSLILSLLPTLIFFAIIYFMFRNAMKRNGNLMGAVGDDKSPAKKIESNKTFKDIAGNKEAIEEIAEIVDYLKNPKKYQTAGARMPHGILLGGPPGTGKTLLAKATAGEANVPFYFISASNFVEMFVGLGAKRVRTVVDEARKNAPAIIFIDELDAIGRTRGAGLGGGNDEREQTLNQLLVEMDGMKENNGILFFAATNRTDVLDPALTRPGRFDRTITVGLPDVKERQEILELHAKGKRLAPDVNLNQVAKRTPGFSGAQLENVINEASLLAVRNNSELITRDDIDEAIDRVMAGPAKKNRVITKEELTMVAYHEAGHAVVGIKKPGANKVQKITIIPRGQAGGYNLMTPEEEKYNATKKELIAVITSFMGGRAAEELIYGAENISTGASDDIAKATRIARKMVTEWGMSSLGPIQYEENEGSPFLGKDYLKSSTMSNQVGHEIDTEIRNIMLQAKKEATEILKENRELLELIKEALLQKETIVAEEIEYISKNMKLPPQKVEENITPTKYSLDDLLDNERIEETSGETEKQE
ncbi:ATP-dependent zinc metalloprotease FtsH [Mycoplasmopsis gallinarum]|uniref:ATP-dependent zinc metalloprotease FtsH n=1 Tax=Mycoplasmopsis gallinarum TaxID=29557 RepID=A0A168RAK4_9BACT|nr:ATP-dependent zinc metalloprotease FtsH [Mycoplasmopsis gallinarum]OAB48784.1 Cell division protein FtsH [Mycoplasmopsis gallinarum]